MAKRANGEGNIYKRKGDGRWQVSFPTGLRNDKGKAEIIYRYASTQAAAAEILRTLQGEKAMGVQSKESRKVQVSQWLEHWVEKDRAANLAPTTLTSYRNHLRLHINPAIGHISLMELETYQIQRMLNGIGQSLSLFVKVYSILHGALEKAVRQKLLVHNPCMGVVFPKEDKKEIRVFSVEEQKLFIQALQGEYYRPLFLTYLYTGMRLGEAPPLTWQDINFEKRSIHVCKKAVVVHDTTTHTAPLVVQSFCKTKSSTRTITITPMLVEVLRKHKAAQMDLARALDQPWDNSQWMFPNMRGNIPHNRNIQEVFERILKKAGIPRATPHTLRHSYATRCFEAGVEVKAISAQLGHSEVKTTYNIYVHLLEDQRVKEIDKLGEIDKLMAEESSLDSVSDLRYTE